MKIALCLAAILLSEWCLSAGDINTNFWDKCAARVKSLHGYVVGVNEYCLKDEVKHLGLRNHRAIAVGDLLNAHLKLNQTPNTPLSEIKKAVNLHTYLVVISKESSAITSRILAFSKLTERQKQELIDRIDEANKLIATLTQDVSGYICNISEHGL